MSYCIPVNEPLLGEKEIEYVNAALRSGWISSSGRFIDELEKQFAAYLGRHYGISVNNGTNALILAMRALDLHEGSEVILPTFTIISCALACIYNNLIPVFVDCEKETWNMDVSQIEQKITDKTKAIMPVHIYGHPVDMDGILAIAQKHNLYVVEDFAEAIGSEYKGKKCGSFGDISCVSFYANKVITTGEGGMCLTDNTELAKRVTRLRNLAFIPSERFVHYELGFNFRLTNVQAAIGLAQVERIEEHVKKKIGIGKKYNNLLVPLQEKGLLKLPMEKSWAKNTYWMYGVVLDESLGINAAEFAKRLRKQGVDARPFFLGMHEQPVFRERNLFVNGYYPVAERIARQGLYLPSGLALTESQLDQVCEAVRELL